ncbi:MAG: phage tail sheath subtilisin-like domain-containing protein [Proteobacteria bacterium]|nr:phage tail sheath subtilisin-like domain-containing protein [Pseudomonadota bacterium]
MEESFAEQIVPGTFIRVQAEGLIAPKGVAFGNVGIVGTAAAAAGASSLGTTQILSSLEDAYKVYAPSDALSSGAQNLVRGLQLLFANGARTVYARGVAAGATQTDFEAGVAELLKEEVNVLVLPELAVGTALSVLGSAAETGENSGRDVLAVVGADAAQVADMVAPPTDYAGPALPSNKRVVLCTPGVFAYDTAAKQEVALPGTYTAAVVAGLIASLAPQSSPTNKVLPGVVKLATKFGYGQLKNLLTHNVLPLEARQGVRVVRGITTEGAAFAQITTRRIVDYAKAGIRQVANPFVGRLNNERVRKALHGALDSFLTTMLVDEALVNYALEVKASRQDEIAGRCVVNVALQPTFSIDYIRVTLALS